MANEIENIDSTNDEEVLDLELEETEEEVEKPIEKPKLSPEQQLAIHKREIKKLEKQLGTTEEKPQPREKASSDLDYGQKAFLKTYGVQGSDELALVKNFMARTGDDLDSLVSDDLFLGKLSKLREAREAAVAVPKSTKRSTTPARDDVSAWLDKPFAEVPSELRRQVLNAKLKSESGPDFAPNSVIIGGSAI